MKQGKLPAWDNKYETVWNRIRLLQQEIGGNSIHLPYSRLPQSGDTPRQIRRVERDNERVIKAARRIADAKQNRVWICRVDDKNLLCTRDQMNAFSRAGLPENCIVLVKPAYERKAPIQSETVKDV